LFPPRGIVPGAAEVANLDRGRAILGQRSIRDSITPRPELGQEMVAVEPHRLPRSELAPESSESATVKCDSIVQLTITKE
jgi:hypothetical protein